MSVIKYFYYLDTHIKQNDKIVRIREICLGSFLILQTRIRTIKLCKLSLAKDILSAWFKAGNERKLNKKYNV